MKINVFGFVDGDVLPDDVQEYGGPIVRSQVVDNTKIIAQLKLDADAVRKSTRLTEGGKIEECWENSVRMLSKSLRKLTPTESGASISGLQGENAPSKLPSPAEIISKKLADRTTIDQLSSWLKSIDPLDQQTVIGEAVRDNDLVLLAAVESHHPKLRPVGVKMHAGTAAKYIEAHAPEGLLTVKNLVRSNVATAQGVVKKLCTL